MLKILPLIFLAMPVQATAVRADCTCRYDGGDVGHGQTACIATANGPTLARCEKVLNVASWTFLNQPCVTTSQRELLPAPAAPRLTRLAARR